jgi:hypothetical protein
VRDGTLVVVDAIFMNNQAAPLGPDTGGGAEQRRSDDVLGDEQRPVRDRVGRQRRRHS